MTRVNLLCAFLLAGLGLTAGATALDAANLFGLVDTGELFRSADGGASWSPVGTIPVRDAVGLAAGSASTELYLAAQSGGIYRSANGGAGWNAVGAVTAPDLTAFALTPAGDLLALTRTGSLYASTDQGATFAPIAVLPGSDWVSLARGPLGRLYALTSKGEVAESQDQGATWSAVGVIVTSDGVAIRRLGAHLYVIARTGEVYRSLDYGVGWAAVGTVSQGTVSTLTDNGTQLVAATREGEVAISADGAAWTWVGAINQLHVTALGTDEPQVTGVSDGDSAPEFTVTAPRPNPSTGRDGVTFGFSLALPGRVRLDVYDVRGRLAYAGPSMVVAAGNGAIRWNPPPLPGGTYFVRMSTDSGRHANMKWTLLR